MQRDVNKFGISAKRGRSTTSPDPYQPQKGLKEPACCSRCHATYHAKHWVNDPQAYAAAVERAKTRHTLCPACHNESEGSPQGVVTLRGDYLWEHETEICNIVQNLEARITERNPLERILRIDRQTEAMVIETSAEKLAEQLGRAIHKAHQGALQVQWSTDHDLCRVEWERRL